MFLKILANKFQNIFQFWLEQNLLTILENYKYLIKYLKLKVYHNQHNSKSFCLNIKQVKINRNKFNNKIQI